MAIRRTAGKDLTESDIGKYVLFESAYQNGICGDAWRLDAIVKSRCQVSRTRLNMKREPLEQERDSFMLRTVKFVADTEIEAEWLRAVDEDKQREITKMLKQLDKKYSDLISSL
jgi:hypothetical protein